MPQAKSGDKVRVHYTGTLDDGSVFDTSEGFVEECTDEGCEGGSHATGPLEFVIGDGSLIPRFEEAVIGLEPGQSVRVKIAADDAYGQRAEEMVAVIDRSEVPAGITPEAGQQMEVVLQDGTPLPVLVTEVTDTSVTLDANHPLAGLDLTFDIRLVEIL
ncbi:MAG: peptidylprolyl isomerase [Deltaproteobacteria bacterium]|nr:peptidylprolyl isomerase [Deltaproteobacteria bacterium]